MKKLLVFGMVAILLISVLATTALAVTTRASYKGNIWTGKPTVFGLGYYCTAAVNQSGGDESTHWAWARTFYNGTQAYQRQKGNVRAVASSGSVHPTGGEGQYGEEIWSSNIGEFKSSAWD